MPKQTARFRSPGRFPNVLPYFDEEFASITGEYDGVFDQIPELLEETGRGQEILF